MPFTPSPPPLADVRRALAVFAHPDDVDHYAGGTVAGWIDDGVDVAYLIVTRGDAGGFDDGTPRELIPAIREAEQRAAARVLGVARVDFLDRYADGLVQAGTDLRSDITRAIRRYRPDRVITSSPVRTWRLGGPDHPDHAAVGDAVSCAVYPDAASPFRYPEQLRDEGLRPWSVREVWYCEGPEPSHYVDVTDTAERKLAALRAHVSQPPGGDAVDRETRERLAVTAAAGGLPSGRLAEAFTIIRRA